MCILHYNIPCLRSIKKVNKKILKQLINYLQPDNIKIKAFTVGV